MSHWETKGKSDEWFTPKYIFEAMNVFFDLDVAAPEDRSFVYTPTMSFITENSLEKDWKGFVWMNPPFGGRNGITPWLIKFFNHGNGIALTPDRTSCEWFQDLIKKSDCVLFVDGKIKFHDNTGKVGSHPSNGTCLVAKGYKGVRALLNAEKNGLGTCLIKITNE